MRKSLSLLMVMLLSMVAFVSLSQAGLMPYPIFARQITVNDIPARGMTINLKDVNTGENFNIILSEGGDFSQDLTDFHTGSDSHIYRVTYCIKDSRCSEFYRDFDITGDYIDLSRNIPYTYTKLYAPYTIYGDVVKDGSRLKNSEIKVTNVDKGKSDTIQTNDNGEYQVNLANVGSYDTGDKIRVSYGEYGATGYISGEYLRIDLTINTQSQETPTEPDNGGGDGGGCSTQEYYNAITKTCKSACISSESWYKDNGWVIGCPSEDIIPDQPEEPEDIIEEPEQEEEVIEPVEPKGNDIIVISIFVGILIIAGIWYIAKRKDE